MISTFTAAARIARLDKSCGVPMFWGIFFTFLFKVFEAAPDVLFGVLVDTVFHREASFLARHGFPADLRAVYVIAGLILLGWLAGSLSQFFGTLGWKRAASAVQFRLRMRLCSDVLSQKSITAPSEGKDSLRSDYRMSNQEIDDVEFFVHRTLEDFFRLVFSTIVVGPLLFVIAPPFLLYALIPILPTFLAARAIQRRIRPGYNAVKRAMKVMYQEIDEMLSGFGVIKDFGIEARFYDKVARAARFLDAESRRTSYLTAAMSPMTRILVQLGVLAILIHAVVMVFHHQISFGEYAASSFLSRKFLLPFTFLGSLADMCAKGIGALEKVLISTQNPHSVLERAEPATPSANDGIRVEAVSYFYGARRIFDGLSADFRPGIVNVIKGPTGVGKSTLLRLLSGDLRPQTGEIRYGSRELQEHLGQLRQNICLVTQFPKLFTASLKDNITLFDPEFDATLFSSALAISLTTDFADDLPQGIESIVGPNGIRLSGGQMQSVGIARAFYSKARVLLLDEPTASFDFERERRFLELLAANTDGRTVILTSHRSQAMTMAGHLVDLTSLGGV